MANRTILEQYDYETGERGLSHNDALAEMAYMFDIEQLRLLDEVYQFGYQKAKEDYY